MLLSDLKYTDVWVSEPFRRDEKETFNHTLINLMLFG